MTLVSTTGTSSNVIKSLVSISAGNFSNKGGTDTDDSLVSVPATSMACSDSAFASSVMVPLCLSRSSCVSKGPSAFRSGGLKKTVYAATHTKNKTIAFMAIHFHAATSCCFLISVAFRIVKLQIIVGFTKNSYLGNNCIECLGFAQPLSIGHKL